MRWLPFPEVRPAVRVEIAPCVCEYVRSGNDLVPICHTHAGAHLRTSANARVQLLPSGRVHVVESCGDGPDHDATAKPDILWYLCGLPFQNPGSASTASTCPYVNTGATPNPNRPVLAGQTPQTSNITRHWQPSLGPINYSINIPTITSANVGNFQTGTLNQAGGIGGGPGDIFIGAGTGHVPFTWNSFRTTINTILTSVASCPYLDIQFSEGAATTTAYDAGLTINSLATFIWDSAASPPGPTGNGINEFIFLQNSNAGLNGGITSMVVEPTSGVIFECDVIYQARNNSTSWNENPVSANGPMFSTGLVHEVGHFLGLDHTNLTLGLPNMGTL